MKDETGLGAATYFGCEGGGGQDGGAGLVEYCAVEEGELRGKHEAVLGVGVLIIIRVWGVDFVMYLHVFEGYMRGTATLAA